MPKKKARGLLKPDVCLALKVVLLLSAFGVLILGEMNAKNVMQEIAFVAVAVFVAILARMAQAGEHQGNLIEALEALEEAIEKASGQAEEEAEEKAPTRPRMSKAYPAMDSRLFIAACAASLLASSGCSKNAKFTYPLDPPIRSLYREPSTAKIAVLPARDLRGASNSDAGIALAFLPLMPYGWVIYERPEAATGFLTIGSFDADLVEDVPKAIAQHWREAGVSKNTFFDQGLLADQADYILQVTLNRTTYEGRIMTYGISIFAAYLWLVGVPEGSFEVTVDLGLELRDKQDRVVWKGSIGEKKFDWLGAYYNEGGDMNGLALSLQKGLDATASSAAETIRRIEEQKAAIAAGRDVRRNPEPAKPQLRGKYYP